jgi:hypothetical protein
MHPRVRAEVEQEHSWYEQAEFFPYEILHTLGSVEDISEGKQGRGTFRDGLRHYAAYEVQLADMRKKQKRMVVPPRILSTLLLPVLMMFTLLRLSCTSTPVAKEEPYAGIRFEEGQRRISRVRTRILCAASYIKK